MTGSGNANPVMQKHAALELTGPEIWFMDEICNRIET